MYEESMTGLIRDFLSNQGYIPYDQIPFFQGKIDFVGIRNEECIVIESKISKWKDALKQAIVYGKGANKSYVALPASIAQYCLTKYYHYFEDSMIGLLSVDLTDENGVKILIKSNKETYSTVMHNYLIDNIKTRKKSSDNRLINFKTKKMNILKGNI